MNEERIVPFEGPSSAKIMLVGEAPGADEVRLGRPFVGLAGKILDQLLTRAGIIREECRIGNVCRVRPRANKFANLSPQQVAEGTEFLLRDIQRTHPNVVVALGARPLFALTGLKGISKWRGSVLWSDTLGCKVIPTYHPSFIQRLRFLKRTKGEAALALFDMKRAAKESKTLAHNPVKRTLVVSPSYEQIMRELKRLHRAEKVAFDCETTRGPSGIYMTHIAFSDTPAWSISIPFTRGAGSDLVEDRWSVGEEIAIMRGVDSLLTDPRVKTIAQNSQFDMCVLEWRYNIKVTNLWMDTMCAFHTLYSELPKSLDTLVSIYTKQPYYGGWTGQGEDQFSRYNAMDAAVTRECADAIEVEMKEFGVLPFYQTFIHPLIRPLLEMQLRGVKIDEATRGKASEEHTAGRLADEGVLEKIAGHPVNVDSPKQLAILLYSDLGLVKKISHKTGNVTVDEKALTSLAAKYLKYKLLFSTILSARKHGKVLSTYLEAPLHDGRMHTSYNIGGRLKNDFTNVESGPETGRLSSSRSIVIGSGTNLQNVPHGECRRMFVPDPGMSLMEVDLSQAEARVVAWLAGEERLINAFLRGDDVHKMNASRITGKAVEDVTEEERTFAKKHVHAFNYMEGVRTFAESAGISEMEAKGIRDSYFNAYPAIRQWQLRVERDLRKNRIMTTPAPFFSKRLFTGAWSDGLVREAVAHVPQSTVGMTLNCALVRLRTLLHDQLLLQVHDSIVLQFHPTDRARTLDAVNWAFNITLTIRGMELVIPWEVETGPNWEDLEGIAK